MFLFIDFRVNAEVEIDIAAGGDHGFDAAISSDVMHDKTAQCITDGTEYIKRELHEDASQTD